MRSQVGELEEVGGREGRGEAVSSSEGHSMSRGPGERNILVCMESQAAWSCVRR